MEESFDRRSAAGAVPRHGNRYSTMRSGSPNADITPRTRDEDLLQALNANSRAVASVPWFVLEVSDDMSRTCSAVATRTDVGSRRRGGGSGLLDLSALWQVYAVDRPALNGPAVRPGQLTSVRRGGRRHLRPCATAMSCTTPTNCFRRAFKRLSSRAADPDVLAIKQTLY